MFKLGGGGSCINSNGGFERPTATEGILDYPRATPPWPSWAVVFGKVEVVRGWAAAEGDQLLDLCGSTSGGGATIVSTVVGQSYALSYALSINTQQNPLANRSFVAVWDGTVIDSNDVLAVPDREIESNPMWVYRSRTVVATSTSANITFYTREPAGCFCGPVLDAVCLEVIPASYPAPSSVNQTVKPIGNVTAAFGEDFLSASITGDLPITNNSSSSNSNNSVSLLLHVGGLRLGGKDVNFNELVTTREIISYNGGDTNSTDVLQHYVYRTPVDDLSAIVHSFSSSDQPRLTSFAGVNFTVPADTVKWSLNFTVDSAAAGGVSNLTRAAQANGFSIRYNLVGSSTDEASTITTTNTTIYRATNTPSLGVTTFYVTLWQSDGSTVVGQVEVLSVALIDGQVAPLTWLDLTPAAAASSAASVTNASCVLEFVFPPFTSSVIYDPSLGLGVLLGRSSSADGGDGGSSSNTALIVGVAVAVPAALALVAGVVVLSLVVTRWQMLQATKINTQAAVNFDGSML